MIGPLASSHAPQVFAEGEKMKVLEMMDFKLIFTSIFLSFKRQNTPTEDL